MGAAVRVPLQPGPIRFRNTAPAVSLRRAVMSETKSLIRRLFDSLWTAVTTIYKVMILLSLVFFLFTLWLLWSGPPVPRVEDNVAVVIAPTGVLVDQLEIDPAMALLDQLNGTPPPQTAVQDVVDALTAAAEDDRIRFAVLKLDGLWGGGLAQVSEIIDAIGRFRASGKTVVAYSGWYDQLGYLAASHADEIVVDPMGMVALEGLSAYQNYFRDLTDKLGVTVNVFRVGEFKSAVEPFIRNDMSPEARRVNQAWLGDLWRHYGATVGVGRALAPEAVDRYITALPIEMKAGASWADVALAHGLVTHVETLRDFRARMAEQVGLDEDHGSFRQIHFYDYLAARDREQTVVADRPLIARVVVQGEIVDGPSTVGVAGGETIAALLDDARRTPEVEAVVLRVDSPGGSVWASEQIRRAVVHLRDEGKPVVVSMGNVAASGGYWISMDADRVLAHPQTITGSIGIFGLIPTLDRALEKVGIHTDGVGTTPLAGAFRLDRPLSPEVKTLIQAEVNRGYEEFVARAAAARQMPVAALEPLAQGRVWSGEAAQTRNLIDALGSQEDAVSVAAELAGLDDWQLQDFAPQTDFASRFLQQLTGGLIRHFGRAMVPDIVLQLMEPLATPVRRLSDPQGRYAHCACGTVVGNRQAP